MRGYRFVGAHGELRFFSGPIVVTPYRVAFIVLQDKIGGDILLGSAKIQLRDLTPEMLSGDDSEDISLAVASQSAAPAVTIPLRYGCISSGEPNPRTPPFYHDWCGWMWTSTDRRSTSSTVP